MAIFQNQGPKSFGGGEALSSLAGSINDETQQRLKNKLQLALESSRIQQESEQRQKQMMLENQFNTISGPQLNAGLGVMGAKPLTPDQSAAYSNGVNKTTADTLFKGAASLNKPVSQSLGLRDNQFWEKQWVDTGKEMNISKASSRTPLGVAVTNNVRSQRASKLLNSSGTFTPQDLNLITTDISAIMKGGSPDEQLLRQQQYGSFYANGINLLQKITANPQNLNVPEVRQHLRDVVNGVISVDNGVIQDHVSNIESQRKDVISRRPNDWAKLKEKALGSSSNTSSGSSRDEVRKALGL